MALAGGIDLGGSKIEAQLFDPASDWALVEMQTIATPADYSGLLAAVSSCARWLKDAGGATVGLGAPGLLDGHGILHAANHAADGKPFASDLAAAAGFAVPVLNDTRAFTLSEARLGAGRGAACLAGLVIGTGLAGAVIRGGVLDAPSGQAGEFGHTAMPFDLVSEHGLPWLSCGCGRSGCYETLVAGPGIPRLSNALVGQALDAKAMAETSEVLAIWSHLVADLIARLAVTVDPDAVVFGGGLSRIPGVRAAIGQALPSRLLAGARMPELLRAEGGDRSGARGAALYASDGAT